MWHKRVLFKWYVVDLGIVTSITGVWFWAQFRNHYNPVISHKFLRSILAPKQKSADGLKILKMFKWQGFRKNNVDTSNSEALINIENI